MNFTGKTALITGASRGIGQAIAELLAERGADVVIADINEAQAKTTAEEIAQKTGRRALPVAVDVASLASCQQMVETSLAEFGKIDILINNAGITRDNLIMRMDEKDFDLVININLKGVWNCCKAVVRPMMKQRYGRIINVSSVSGIGGLPGQTNYSASKAGVIGMTKALAKEVAARNITVNAVAPGYVTTVLTQDLSDEVKDFASRITPIQRWAEPREIAYAAAFFASDEAAYITGQVLRIDGGMLLG
ncbi:MAG: 3-oxoacyl-[acyl-carrier-protein] reductase [Anaerolineales bacterium]|nr:3-oxoacyl-[acyl-carrier-protein] reductase [Anaerolineales bacterium]